MVLIFVAFFGFIFLMSLLMVLLIFKCYKKVPAGNVMVINKLSQRKAVSRTGSIVMPFIHSAAMVHAEIEEVVIEKDGAKKTVLVALVDNDEAVIKAEIKLGRKSVSEIKAILKRMLEKADNPEAALAEVGYRIIS